MKVKYVSILVGFVALVILMIFQTIRIKKRAKRNFEIFNNASLDGNIIDISQSVGEVFIKLDNDNIKYSFIPKNDNKPFYNNAKKGSHIIKPIKSDTLKLIRGNEEYKYVFEKF
jgi:hypothetical protein